MEGFRVFHQVTWFWSSVVLQCVLVGGLLALMWSLIAKPAFPAELGLALWLTVKGVNVPKWKERARG